MRHLSRWFAAPLTTVALLGFAGCDGDSGNSVGKPPVDNTVELDMAKTDVPVSGSVTVGGKAMTGGDVIFDAKTSSRSTVEAVKAPIGADGSYSAKTLVGTNHITVDAPGMSDADKAKGMTKVIQPTDTKVDVVIP